MRKFLMVAAVVAVAACGKKQGDTGSMEATGAAAGAAVDTMRAQGRQHDGRDGGFGHTAAIPEDCGPKAAEP